jgi:hypothetical protein
MEAIFQEEAQRRHEWHEAVIRARPEPQFEEEHDYLADIL